MKNCIKEIRERKRITINNIAEKLEMTYQNASDIEKNKVTLNSKYIEPLCEILNCTISELFGEQEYRERSEDWIKLKYFTNINNLINVNNLNNYEFIGVSKRLLEILSIEDYKKIIILKASEKNMEPIIFNNDFLIIDLDNKEILNNRIYLVNENDKLKIKRIKRTDPNSLDIVISSDNEVDGEYPPYKIPIEKAKTLFFGRVIFYGKNII